MPLVSTTRRDANTREERERPNPVARRGELTLVAGEPGVGLSTIMTRVAYEATRPQDGQVAGYAVVEASKVGVVALEGQRQIEWIHDLIQMHHEAVGGGNPKGIGVHAHDPLGPHDPELSRQDLADIIRDHAAGTLIVDALDLRPERHRRRKGGVLSDLADLAREFDVAVVACTRLPGPVRGNVVDVRTVDPASLGLLGAVHILTRPRTAPDEQHVVRWTTTRMARAALPEPVEVEILHGEGTVSIAAFDTDAPEPAAKPETATERAVRVIGAHLESRRGHPVRQQDLAAAATRQGCGEQAIKAAYKPLRRAYGDALEVFELAERGSPRVWVLARETAPTQTQNSQEPIQNDKDFGSAEGTNNPAGTPPAREPAPLFGANARLKEGETP